MKPEKVKLRKHFRKTFDMLSKQTGSKSIDLEYEELWDAMPHTFLCDKEKLTQIIVMTMNLLIKTAPCLNKVTFIVGKP